MDKTKTFQVLKTWKVWFATKSIHHFILGETLDLYSQVGNTTQPRLCFDERPCQLLGEVMAPFPTAAGQIAKQAYEYEPNGTACVLLAYDLDTHQCYLPVREQRTKKDYAEFMDWLLKTHYPDIKKIDLLQDNGIGHPAQHPPGW